MAFDSTTEVNEAEKQDKDTGYYVEAEEKNSYSKWIITLVTLLLLASLACNGFLWFRSERLQAYVSELEAINTENYYHFTSITVELFKEKVDSGEEFIVLISRPNCSNCQALEKPFIQLARERGIQGKIYHLNVERLHQDADAWVLFKETYGLQGTPTYIRFAGGENISCVGWTHEASVTYSMAEKWIDAQSDFFGF